MAVITENKARNTGLAESQVLSLSYGRVVVKPAEKQRGLVPESYEGYQILEPGDVVIRPTDLQNDQTSIRVGRVHDRGIITSAYVGLRSRSPWTTDFAYAYLAVIDSTKRIYGMGSGLRQQLGWADLKRMPCLVPPVDEQAAIVKYLAHANARIDKAITAKRRLIALVDEEKQAVARDLLTGGSGEIGRIPGHWQSVITKRLCRITTGAEDSGNSVLDGEYPFFVRGREILRSSDYLFDAEAVMTPGDGQGGVGKVFHYYHGQFQAHQRVYVFLNFKGVRARYFYWYLSTFFRSYALAQSNTVTMESLRQPVLASFPVAFPSQREQLRLVEQIEAETSRMQNRVDVAQREIALLGEFRARLVADVVTGQADVRAIAASLPEIDPDSPTPDRLADGDQIVDAAMERSEV
ncbi:MAG: restriction endonuclease subunit S [Tetrasphaera sp.]|nr:restriction endonuclease subunit S [Tetrasphaera sp.]